MGPSKLRAADVGPLLKIDAPTSIDPPGSYVPTTSPTTGVTCRGVPTNWQVSDVIAANGPRVPAAAVAPHTMRVAIVLAVPRGAGASAADLARLDSLRVHFEPWYSWATDGRGTVDTHLERRAGAVRVTHTRLRDTEDIGTPRALGAHVSVDGGNLGLTIVPSSVHVRLRPVGGGSFGMLMMNPVAPDSFVAIVPPFPGDFEYYLEAASDSVGIAATDPALGPAAPILVHVGPDLSPPLVLHTPVPLQAAFRLPQKLLARVTDNLGVDSVWAEYSVDGGPIASTPTLRAGPDSFTVSLGGGLASGQRLAYRLVARDAASAHNLGLSNPAFDTLHVERDAWEDFENGEGLLHSSAIYSYRDAWHAAVEPLAPERGVGMLCGNDDGPYAPHLDAALYTPYLYAVPPGALLRFDHRYELEDYDATRGWDGGMLEGQSNGGAWLPLTPQGGYPKTLASKVSTVNAGTPCWSGDSQGWRTETVSLASLGSGPAIVRWRMLTDDLFGREGWRVDHVRLIWSDGVTEVPLSSDATPWRVSPNPARQGLRMMPPAGERGAVSWELFDLAGRRVATLWRGELPPGGALQGAVPTTVAPGLYFSRLMRGGHELARARVAIVR